MINAMTLFFDIENFSFLDGNVLRRTFMVYISQLIFAIVCNHVADFNARNDYKYRSVILVFFPPLGLWSGNFFLIAPFSDHCLLVF